MDQRLSMVTLGVADVTASRRFYERLGWKGSSAGDGKVAFFQAGGVVVAIWGRADLARDACLETQGGVGGVALAYNVPRKQDVDTVLAEAEKAGARILRPAEDAFWGGYTGYFADPDGHPWEVAWNPGFPLDKDGSIILPT